MLSRAAWWPVWLSLSMMAGGCSAQADPLAGRRLAMPVAGLDAAALRDTFHDARGGRSHEAIDIMAPRGTPVFAVDDGVVVKLFNSVPGGLTVYQFDAEGRLAYYYAHLDRYADGLSEGRRVRRCELLGHVGSTGNADPRAPHLHFAVFELGPQKQWWKGVALNPFEALTAPEAVSTPAGTRRCDLPAVPARP